jgi:hypothetical protein
MRERPWGEKSPRRKCGGVLSVWVVCRGKRHPPRLNTSTLGPNDANGVWTYAHTSQRYKGTCIARFALSASVVVPGTGIRLGERLTVYQAWLPLGDYGATGERSSRLIVAGYATAVWYRGKPLLCGCDSHSTTLVTHYG